MFGAGTGFFLAGSQFTPLSIPGIHSLYSADFCTQSAGTATVIPDQSNNHEVSLTVVSGNPLYTAADPLFNNMPSFSSVVAGRRVEGAFHSALAQPSTYYMVHDIQANSNKVYWRSNQGNYADSAGYYYDSGLIAHMQTLDGGNAVTAGSAASTGQYVSCAVYNGNSSALYLNNSQTPFASSPSQGQVDGNSNLVMTIGTFTGQSASYIWTMAIQYQGAHDAVTRKKLFAYLGQRYNIGTT